MRCPLSSVFLLVRDESKLDKDITRQRGTLESTSEGVAERYDLVEKMQFLTVVERCEWLEERGSWQLTVRNTLTGEEEVV